MIEDTPLNNDQPIPKVQIVEDFTRDEVIHEIEKWTQRKISVPTFYHWLTFCLVEPKPLYTRRDVQKFLFISNELKRVNLLSVASDKLKQRLETSDDVFDF